MDKMSNLNYWNRLEQIPLFIYLLKWGLVASLVGFLVGSASAALLVSLNWATDYRESHLWIIALLPLAGLVIGLLYHYYGKGSDKGNNYLIEEIHHPKNIIPFRMAPLVFIGTVLTHLFGGSAGREGTAVQMGGAISDKLSSWLHFKKRDRRIMIIIGVSAGFASVFGTPLAGAVFALEVLVVGRIRYEAILPSFMAAIAAHYTCHSLWCVAHTHYEIGVIPEISPLHIASVLLVGILFGLAAMLFSKMVRFWSQLAKKYVSYAPLRPVIGGGILVVIIALMGTTKFIGLGVPTIVESFTTQQEGYVFLLKIVLTTFTLGVGFKGGEVTPLFFIGATLGSALFGIIPLPMGLLAGMGFVAVFAGATNTPIACTLMGIELFGAEAGIWLGLACVTAYLFSGHTGIYTAQAIGSPKHTLYALLKGKELRDIK